MLISSSLYSNISSKVAAMVFSVLVTCGLFYVMYYLTNPDNHSPVLDVDAAPAFDFIRVKPKLDQLKKKKRTPKQKAVRNQPKTKRPPQQRFRVNADYRQGDLLTLDNLDIRSGFGTALFGSQEISPVVRVEPIYPLRARSRGIEGWVEVEFAIDKDGSVINPVIVDSEPSSIFNHTTLKAVSRWRYQPQIIDNTAVVRSGVRVIIEFQLED